MGAPGRDAPCERSTTTRAAVSSSSTRSRCEGNAGARDVVMVGSFAGAMSLGFGLEIGDSMLFARPEAGGLHQLPCEALQLLGVGVALLSLGTLGRSFGLVAANRGLRTRGPYGLIRHPAYTGYLVAYLGYVAENPSLRNIALLGVSTAFQLVRIREEERVLSDDDGYRAYARRVRFRLVPYVY